MRRTWMKLAMTLALLAATAAGGRAAGTRIKDITEFEGARSNQLDGHRPGRRPREHRRPQPVSLSRWPSTCSTRFRINSLINSNNHIDPVYRAGSVSVVAVTAELGPFARRGSRIDVKVSVYGRRPEPPGRHADVHAAARGRRRRLRGRPGIGVDRRLPVHRAAGQQHAAGQRPEEPPDGRPRPRAAASSSAKPAARSSATARSACCCASRITPRRAPSPRAINEQFPRSAVALDAGTVQVFVPRERQPGRRVLGRRDRPARGDARMWWPRWSSTSAPARWWPARTCRSTRWRWRRATCPS